MKKNTSVYLFVDLYQYGRDSYHWIGHLCQIGQIFDQIRVRIFLVSLKSYFPQLANLCKRLEVTQKIEH